MKKQDLTVLLESSRQSATFQDYLLVRNKVLAMMEEEHDPLDIPSSYWSEESAGFDYMLDASPLIVRKLREHCHHLSGCRAYDYRCHHAHQYGAFKRKLERLQQQDKAGLIVPESPLLGGFGYEINGELFNTETLKFYEALIALDKAGVLNRFRPPQSRRKVVMEIGAGWGGYAYQFKTLFPNVTYIIVDLPQTLIFSAVYLRSAFPLLTFLTYGDKPKDTLLEDYLSYDFIFLPHFFIRELQLSQLDLAINIASFQEMTSDQVKQHLSKAYELGCTHFYSLNRDRSPHNNELGTVSSLLASYFNVREIKVFENIHASSKKEPGLKDWILEKVKKVARRLLGKKRSIYEYCHLLGVGK